MKLVTDKLKEDVKLYIDCTFGEKSHMNLFGKICLSPLIVIAGVGHFLLEFLFAKRS